MCNEALCLRMRGPLDREALLRSVAELAKRCDTWRATIELDPHDPAGAPVACVRAFDPFPVDVVDLGAVAETQRETTLAKHVHSRVHTRLDLSQGPLMRVTLLRCSDELHVLLFVTHHVAFDALSLFEILPRSLAEMYAAIRRGQTLPAGSAVTFGNSRATSTSVRTAWTPPFGGRRLQARPARSSCRAIGRGPPGATGAGCASG